jgi:hypothetical protein
VAAASAKAQRTRPYTPRANGKTERFIQTSLREWAYARPYVSSVHASGERLSEAPAPVSATMQSCFNRSSAAAFDSLNALLRSAKSH